MRSSVRTSIFAAIATVASSIFAVPLAGSTTTSPSITSDKADYAPGETVTLTGATWQPGESVHLVVNDDAGQTWNHATSPDPVADATGAFAYSFSLPWWFVANYSVTATGSVSGTATASFTDSAIGLYDQCSNDDGDGYADPADTGCRWNNGNLQSNNSTYTEGDATVQRLWLTDFIPGSTHTVTLKYGTTKGGDHAYDYLTSWDWSEDWATTPDRCQDITGCDTATESALAIPNDPNLTDVIEPAPSVDREFRMRGAALTAASTPVIVSGTYAGDSETIITITFTIANSGPMCVTKGSGANATTTCSAALFFGAHVALTQEWNEFNGTAGAGAVSGSPYHVALDQVDGAAIGQRDNQMQSGAIIPNGTIVITKNAVPDSAQDFSFSLTNGTTVNNSFLLDDDTNATLPASRTFSVPPGTYSAGELNIPTGWTLSNIVCTDPTNNSTVNVATASATLAVASAETVNCTFTNTQGTNLTVAKTVTASYGRTYAWSLTKDVNATRIDIAEGGTATFDYTVIAAQAGVTDAGWAMSGDITVTNPNSFAISGVDLTDSTGIGGGANCTVTNGTGLTVPANGSLTRSYSCTFTSQPSYTGTNTATATWPASEGLPSTSATGTAAVAFTQNAVNKTVTIVDDKTDPLNPITLGTLTATDAAPFTTDTYTYSLTKSGVPGTCTDYTNTAKITETGHTASKTVTVCVGSNLTVAKTAAGTFDREYLWRITKSGPIDPIKIADDETATVPYSVLVEQTGVADSGWTLAGTISITNPNDWQAVTVTSLTDIVDNGGTCTVAPGPYVVPAATVANPGSLAVDYSCTYPTAGPTGLSGTNTATATWNNTTATTPNGSASGTTNFTLTKRSAGDVNKTISVTDTVAGALGSLNASDDVTALATHTYTYNRSIDGVAGTCTEYDNTATIVETDQSSSAAVTVCVGVDLTVTKTAVASKDRTYLWKIAKAADTESVSIPFGTTATVGYTVTVTPDGFIDSGYALYGEITVTNPNDWQDISTTITDVVDPGVGATCTVVSGIGVVIPADGSVTLKYNCTFPPGTTPVDGSNTATVSWNEDTAHTPNGTASGTADVTFALDGETNFTITVIDDKTNPASPVTLGTATWGTDPTRFTYELELPGASGTCRGYTNIAVIDETGQSADDTVEVCTGADLTVIKTAEASNDRLYKWLIDKVVDGPASANIPSGSIATFNYVVTVTPNGTVDSNWNVTGDITVTNPNDWQDIEVDVTDAVDVGGGAVCTVASGTDATVLRSTSKTFAYSCTFTSDPADSGVNTATATWDEAAAHTPNGSASGTAAFTFVLANETNKTIHITDDRTTPAEIGTAYYPDGATTFTYDLTYTGAGGMCTVHTNIATITETGQSDPADVTVCVGLDLIVSKTATGSFAREYLWTIDKSVDRPHAYIPAGGSATFTYGVQVDQTGVKDSAWKVTGVITVTNPNRWEAITLTSLSDAIPGATCTVEAGPYVVPVATAAAPGTLAVGYTCTFATQPTLYTGTNTATATWDAATAATPTGADSGTADFTLVQDTTKDVNKTITVTDTEFVLPLGTVTATDTTPFTTKTFTYDRTLNGVAGDCTTSPNTATITESGQFDTVLVTVCVGLDLTIDKTVVATKERTYLWTIAKTAGSDRVDIADDEVATVGYTVTVSPNGFVDSGYKLSGTISVTNPNNWQAITAAVTDLTNVGGGAICTVDGGATVVIAASATNVLDYTCTFTGTPIDGTNTATATWAPATASTPTGTVSDTADVAFAVVKETNKTINIVDDKTNPASPVTLGSANHGDPPTVFSYSLELAGVGGTCTTYTNIATITETAQTADADVTVCVGNDLTVTKTAVASNDRLYQWLIAKSVDDTRIEIAAGGIATFNYTVTVTPDGSVDSNWVVTGSITVNNPNDWQAITVDITDAVDVGGGADCTVSGGVAVVVPKSGSKTVNYACTFTSAPSATGTNTATVTWDGAAAHTPSGSATGTATVTFNANEINKTITVIDDKTNPASPVTLGTATFTGGEKTFSYSITKAGGAGTCTSYTNTAVIDETDQSATKTVEVCVGLDLSVTKTAIGSFVREYLWTIDKSVNKTKIEVAPGGSGTFAYTVKVDQTGVLDSAWVASGVITVSNPNHWQAITLTGLTDAVDNGGTCTVAAGPYVVPAATAAGPGTLTVAYSCAYATKPSSYSATNTATATWNAATAATPTGTDSGTAALTLVQNTTKDVNKTVDVTDSYAGALGSVTATNAAPFATKTFTYSRTIAGGAEGTCADYPNTATITQTAQSDSQSVTLCVGLNLTLVKFYDTNLNGVQDPGEPGIAGWKFRVSGGTLASPVIYTAGSAGSVVAMLSPGSYTIVEGKGSPYLATTPTSVTIVLVASTTVKFGNVCLGAGGGLTPGFWSNKNGQALVGSDDLLMLRNLHLVGASGAAFDPTTYAQLKTWLLNGTATNMAYMLSVHTAAMSLNVLNGKVSAASLVYAPGVPGASSLGFISIVDLLAAANAALLADGNTPSGDVNRVTQEAIKNALDNANNNRNFLQSKPCPVPTLTF